jgi:hypothetical protein
LPLPVPPIIRVGLSDGDGRSSWSLWRGAAVWATARPAAAAIAMAANIGPGRITGIMTRRPLDRRPIRV